MYPSIPINIAVKKLIANPMQINAGIIMNGFLVLKS
jgi:hypothetical protein